MTIIEMKQQIEKRDITSSLLIFVCLDNNHFVAHQYAAEIARIKNMQIHVVDTLEVENSFTDDLFGDATDSDMLTVYYVEDFSSVDSSLLQRNNLIIITDKETLTHKDTLQVFESNIVQIPKLEDYQIKDYIYSLADGVNTRNLDALQNLCNNDIYRIDNELAKIRIFDKLQRDELFTEFAKNNIFGTSASNIFELTNAIVKRDVSAIAQAQVKLNLKADDVMLLLTNLQRNFRDLLIVTFNPNSSINDERFIGADEKETKKLQRQFYPIKNTKTMYTLMQVVKIYEFLTAFDKKIKSGEHPVTDNTIDYIILKILDV